MPERKEARVNRPEETEEGKETEGDGDADADADAD